MGRKQANGSALPRAASPTLRVAFCHPDLGLGGAERLVVDAALALGKRGHKVDVFTAYHDPKRCFEETIAGPFSVHVAGGWFPRTVLGRMHALCAYIRCVLCALYLSWAASRRGRYDVVFVDQVSVVVPVLHLFTSSKVLFYCHFPDLLLAQRRSRLHSLYRLPLDWLEQATTGQADLILVNSQYTQGVFAETFQRLARRNVVPRVLYPAVAIPTDDELAAYRLDWRQQLPRGLVHLLEGGCTFLSINRFERKKGLPLALHGLAWLKAHQPGSAHARLVMAGGYDKRLAENRECFEEIKALVQQLGLQDQVWLLPSFTDAQRSALLAACSAVVYTPQNEHFGIVPLEAMAAGRPVIACNSGGPRESVVHNKTGLLCEPTAEAFGAAMLTLTGAAAVQRMGAAAHLHVKRRFSQDSFGTMLEQLVRQLAAQAAAKCSKDR